MKGKFLIQVSVAFGAEQQLGAVPGNIYMHWDFSLSGPKTHLQRCIRFMKTVRSPARLTVTHHQTLNRWICTAIETVKRHVTVEPAF